MVSKEFNTQAISGDSKSDDFKYEKHFCYKNFNSTVLNYLNKSNICFKLKGFLTRKKPEIPKKIEKPKE